MEICKICNKELQHLKALTSHIKAHHITSQEYYDQFILTDENEKKCKVCKQPVSFINMIRGYCKHCSTACTARSPECKEKSKLTCIKHYGVDNASKSPVVVAKIETSMIRNHGVSWAQQSSTIRKTTVDNNQLKYGVPNVYQIPEVQEKYRRTCQERYGVDNPFQLDDIKQRIRETCLERYGFPVAFQSLEIQLKYKQTCLLNYGVDNYSKTFEFRLFCREMLKERIELQTDGTRLQIRPMKGKGEDSCFDELEKNIPYKIHRDVYKIGYYPDGFIEEINLVIEFDEPDHMRSWYIKHDMKRDIDLLSIGCGTFRIKQIEWDNQELRVEIINELKKVIENAIQSRSETSI